jgi:hypothetical protein
MDTMRFRYIEPLYGFYKEIDHIAVTESATKKLTEMADALVGTDDAVAIYIPETTDDVYEAGNKRGRVVGAVRLLPMPAGKAIADYFYHDWDGKLRWPVGWPCIVVAHAPAEICPTLRTTVTDAHGPNAFYPYVKQFQHGPSSLTARWRGCWSADSLN